MAYAYVSAKVRSKGLDSTWSDQDISNMNIYLVYSTFSKIILKLSASFLSSNIYVNMDDVRNLVPPGNVNLTVSQWLTSLGNRTITYSLTEPDYSFKSVKYGYAWECGYSAKPVDYTKSVDAKLLIEDCPDIILTKNNVDYSEMEKRCLVSVNGFFHFTMSSNFGLYVIGAGKTGLKTNDNRIGIYSFNNVCDIKLIPITSKMIFKTSLNQNYSDEINIVLPEDIGNRTPLMSIGGYLHVLDGTYRMTNNNTLSVNMTNFALPDRYFDSVDKIDLSGLGLSVSSKNKYQISVEELFSDNVIKNYFTLSQSFVILMNTTSPYVRKHNLEKTNIPGEFLNPIGESFPMMGSLGKVHEYKYSLDNNRFVCQTVPVIENQYLFRTTNWRNMVSIDNQRFFNKKFYLQRANLLEFGVSLS